MPKIVVTSLVDLATKWDWYEGCLIRTDGEKWDWVLKVRMRNKCQEWWGGGLRSGLHLGKYSVIAPVPS